MPHRLIDRRCETCEHCWEDLIMPGQSEKDLSGCPECGSLLVSTIPGGLPTKCHDPGVRTEVLKKRSVDHSNRTRGEAIERLKAQGKIK